MKNDHSRSLVIELTTSDYFLSGTHTLQYYDLYMLQQNFINYAFCFKAPQNFVKQCEFHARKSMRAFFIIRIRPLYSLYTLRAILPACRDRGETSRFSVN